MILNLLTYGAWRKFCFNVEQSLYKSAENMSVVGSLWPNNLYLNSEKININIKLNPFLFFLKIVLNSLYRFINRILNVMFVRLGMVQYYTSMAIIIIPMNVLVQFRDIFMLVVGNHILTIPPFNSIRMFMFWISCLHVMKWMKWRSAYFKCWTSCKLLREHEAGIPAYRPEECLYSVLRSRENPEKRGLR